MIMWLSLLIPIIASVVLRYYYGRKMAWWEYLIPFAITFIIIGICAATSEYSQTKDTEYWGGYITELNYYEPWDEEVACLHAIHDSKGNVIGHMHAYDVDDHPARYEMTDSNGVVFNCDEETFWSFVERFGNQTKLEMNHDFHSYDGEDIQTTWPGDDRSLEPTTVTHTYENRVQASSSIMNYPRVDGKKLKLFEYPKPDGYDCPVILGYHGKDYDKAERQFQLLNAKYGAAKKVRLWVLVFKDRPYDVSLDQEAYWKGGNKNEVVICVGINKANEVTWSKIFSWSDQETFKVKIRQAITDTDGKTFDPYGLSLYTLDKLNELKGPVRKDFDEYSYLRVDPPQWVIWLTFILSLVATVITSFVCVNNNYDEDNPSGESRYRWNRRW